MPQGAKTVKVKFIGVGEALSVFRRSSREKLWKRPGLADIHPETPDEILRVSNSERRLNLVIAHTDFSREIFVLARKSRVCAEAYIGTGSRSVEIGD